MPIVKDTSNANDTRVAVEVHHAYISPSRPLVPELPDVPDEPEVPDVPGGPIGANP